MATQFIFSFPPPPPPNFLTLPPPTQKVSGVLYHVRPAPFVFFLMFLCCFPLSLTFVVDAIPFPHRIVSDMSVGTLPHHPAIV